MIRSLVISAALACLCGAGAASQTVRPAPDYYLDALINTTTARQLALACPGLSVNLPVVAQASGAVINRLDEDGFDMTAENTGMEDAGDALAARQDAFVAKHGLQSPTQDLVCAAGRSEIADGSGIGRFLIEVSE